jgi:hypothetical protein
MGLTTEQVQKATTAVDKLTSEGVKINLEADTLKTMGIYFVAAAFVAGLSVSFFHWVFNKAFSNAKK